MPLKKSSGNMYPWLSHMHSHLAGECIHRCKYCYAQRSPRYHGPLRIIEGEFRVDYGEGKTIFIEHMQDLWASNVTSIVIETVLAHCVEYPKNTYVFQTKNPARYLEYIGTDLEYLFPESSILGVTIETNRDIPDVSFAPKPADRFLAMKMLKRRFPFFVTIEPVLDFDPEILASWIGTLSPKFINLGADSKGHNLPEPPIEKIEQLVELLKGYNIDLREKHNLQRLRKLKGG